MVRCGGDGVHIGDILWPAGRALVLEHGSSTDHRDRSSVQCKACPLGDSFFEGNSVGAIQNVDASRGQSDLQNAVISGEVCSLNFKRRKRRSECGERAVHALRVALVGPDEDVHVLGGARMAVEGHGVPIYQDKLRTCVGQLEQQVAKVIRKLDQPINTNLERISRGSHHVGMLVWRVGPQTSFRA